MQIMYIIIVISRMKLKIKDGGGERPVWQIQEQIGDCQFVFTKPQMFAKNDHSNKCLTSQVPQPTFQKQVGRGTWIMPDPPLSGLVRPRGWSLTRTPIVR